MRSIAAVLLTGFFVLLFSVAGSAQANDTETLKKLNSNFLNAVVNRDTAALGKVLADDFILINPGGIKRNRADNLASALAQNQQVVSVHFDSVDVRLITADVGLVAAWTTNVIKSGDKQTTLKISYQDVYIKRDNTWAAVAAHVALLGTK